MTHDIGSIGRPAIDRAWRLDLSPTDKYILLAHAYFANRAGRAIFPSVAMIAWMTGFESRTIRASRARLIEKGVLQVVGSRKGGRRKAVRMVIDLDAGLLKEWVIHDHGLENSDRGSPILENADRGSETRINDPQNADQRSADLSMISQQIDQSTYGVATRRHTPDEAGNASSPEGMVAGASLPADSDVPNTPPASKNAGSTRNSKRRDPRTDSPQIQAFREVTGKLPPRDLYDDVIAAIGDLGADDLRPFWRAWLALGWNPTNLAWLLEYAVKGIMPGSGRRDPTRKNGRAKSARDLEYERMSHDAARRLEDD